jgi:uncharacterized protein YceH (UPF0502 family)
MDLPQLNPVEARVFGSLIEKALTTPDYYPLSLPALVNACNQSNNREPVLSLGEADVIQALDLLREKRLAYVTSGGTNRVAKYGHKLADLLFLPPAETALLTELLLRGPQTPGELRTRASRMHPFADLAEVVATLGEMAAHAPPLVAIQPRQPGMKESRYAQLLASEARPAEPGTADSPGTPAPSSDRIAVLEAQVAALQKEVADLRAGFAEFRKQFE